MPEEEETVKANHRKAVEEVTRAILKNPDGAATGPKNPARKMNSGIAAGKTGIKAKPKKVAMSL